MPITSGTLKVCMPQRTLRFRIRQDGLVEESVEGVVGDACHELTASIEEALGSVENHEPTSESFLTEDQTQALSAKLK